MRDYTKLYNHLQGRQINRVKDHILTTQCGVTMQHNFCGTFGKWCKANRIRINKYEFNSWAEKHGYMMRYLGNGYFKQTIEQG